MKFLGAHPLLAFIFGCICWIFAVLPDPQVKVVGPLTGVNLAREILVTDLDTKSSKVTLKINIAHTEHSHIIGREGINIKKG